MYCRIRENFTTNTTTIDDVTSQGDKNIMLTDAHGNISLVKFSDTVIKLQDMINALNQTVIKLQGDLATANNEISNLKKQTLRVPLLRTMTPVSIKSVLPHATRARMARSRKPHTLSLREILMHFKCSIKVIIVQLHLILGPLLVGLTLRVPRYMLKEILRRRQ